MLTDFQSLPTPTHRFKPYILHTTSVFESTPCNFQKRYYKNIHHLTLQPSAEYFRQRIPMPKTLCSLSLDYWRSGENLPLVKKLVKPYKKYLKKVQGGAKHLETLKLLPFLTRLEMSLTRESFKILALSSGFKKLHFNFVAQPYSRPDGDELLKKFKSRLSRSLVKIKGLRNMSMTIMNQDMGSTNHLLEIIDQDLSLDSLEQGSIRFVSGPIFKDIEQPYEQKPSISKVLSRLTYLSANNPEWYSLLLSYGKFTNLSVLELQFASSEKTFDLKDLFQFHNLTNLQKLTLNLTSPSLPSEIAFFENLTLPLLLQDLNLTLYGFTLSLVNDNTALSSQFSKRLQEAKGVKALDLNIIKNAHNLALVAKFYCLFIQCFDSLETLDSSFLKRASFFRKSETSYQQVKPLDFQEFWTAVAPSKETLQKISVSFSEIIFPERVKSLETGFPRLRNLELKGSVSSPAGLGIFCQKIPSLTNVILQEMKFEDEEWLQIFLDDMEKIPEGASFELHLDVGNIKQRFLIDCLKKYIKEVKVKGRLAIFFKEVQVEDVEKFREILTMVAVKGCFRPFQMVMIGKSRPFLDVMNKRVVKWQVA